MSSYCCFWCPQADYSERALDDLCGICGRSYGDPLSKLPARIGNYDVIESIGRGFYGAAYRARQQSLGRTVVLKVVPTSVYTLFNKDWVRECAENAEIAEGTPFVANITDQFDALCAFGDSELECHVAVLENIVGPTLEGILKEPESFGLVPHMAAQISVDLFEILHIFSEHHRFHNDLHAGNIIIQSLSQQTLRTGVICPSVRAVAIDLGSVLDKSQSGSNRLGDQHLAARHISDLSKAICQIGGNSSDLEYRVASTLRGLAEHLAPHPDAHRIMTIDDASKALQAALAAVDEPWRQPLSLHRFGDAYNAQALESWYVPQLWFDPGDKWLAKTTVRGPQVITGMRGCGKTMLLRALHFHARATQTTTSQGSTDALDKIEQDDFVGVYASCQKLLNPQEFGSDSSERLTLPFERLFVAYLRDVVQVLRHIRSLNHAALLSGIDVLLRDALRPLKMNNVSLPETGEREFEQFLVELQFELANGNAICQLKMAPAEAFGHLASVIRNAAPILNNKYVLFLLDDVSTRYLPQDVVREVISQLLFQHSHCAFRITTETQALHRVLLSPGGSAPADPNRDYEEFNLGNEVYRLLKEGSLGENIEFVSEILRRRGQQFRDPLYLREPSDILGDVNLEDIAREIAGSPATSPARKRVYRGLRALQAVCVGDLGDVIKLYEKILRHARIDQLPVSPEKQTDSYLEHSASLVHFLNRRDQKNKNLALAFAQAAGELLQRSAKNGTGAKKRRLRQYTKLYVRVDAGPDFDEVTHNLMDLLDSGVFVYDGGVPRTKARDHDPVLQFKLSYRKMLGLASFIGLSDRDRFELSGEKLRRWLAEPDQAKNILVDSEAKRVEINGSRDRKVTPAQNVESNQSKEPTSSVTSDSRSHKQKPRQDNQLQLAYPAQVHEREIFCPPSLGVSSNSCSLEAWKGREVDAVVVALGFEDRTLASAERLLDVTLPRRAILVRYSDDDQGREIERLFQRAGVTVEVVTSADEMADALKGYEKVIVDSTGLSKPFLFLAVRDVLAKERKISVMHTLAEHYYPKNRDLLELGVVADKPLPSEVFSRLGEVLMGESGPYRLELVHHVPANPERWRALLASASPKNDRLLHLLDERGYDTARIFVPPPTTPRRRVAWTAVELAASAADANIGLIEVDTNDMEGALKATEAIYKDLYFESGANVEIGLTGAKIHAVAFAALAAAARVSYAWYVSPQQFDRKRFTEGVSKTHCFELSIQPESLVEG